MNEIGGRGLRSAVTLTLVLGLVFGPILAGALPVAAAGSIVTVAHRGDMLVAPENTLAGYGATAIADFESVEIDVRFTSDGYPVVIHDATIDRMTNGSGSVASMTFATLRTYRVNVGPNATVLDQKVPTLWEVLNALSPAVPEVLVELKVAPANDTERGRVIGPILSTGMWPRAVLTAYDAQILPPVRAYSIAAHNYPIPTGRYVETQVDPATLATQTTALVGVRKDMADSTYVAALHAVGRKVYAFTADDPAEWVTLEASGVDGVITDAPHDLRAWARYR